VSAVVALVVCTTWVVLPLRLRTKLQD
jgi:hypothetical protein